MTRLSPRPSWKSRTSFQTLPLSPTPTRTTLTLPPPWIWRSKRVLDKHAAYCGKHSIQVWVEGILKELNPEEFAAAYTLHYIFPISRWLMDAKILFDNDDSDEFLGFSGHPTDSMRQTFEKNKRFWNLEGEDILLQGVHATILAEEDKTTMFLHKMYGVEETLAAVIAEIVHGLVKIVGFEFPLWTLYALAVTYHDEPLAGYGQVPDKILIGDGLIDYYEALILEGTYFDHQWEVIGLDMILAHEVAHHVQFDSFAGPNYGHSMDTAVYKELMAYAMGGYFSTHPRGSALGGKDVDSAFSVAFNTETCDFWKATHHGTIDQIVNAMKWGVHQSQRAHGKGTILTVDEFVQKFTTELFPYLLDSGSGF